MLEVRSRSSQKDAQWPSGVSKNLQEIILTKSSSTWTFGAKSYISAGNKKPFVMNITLEREWTIFNGWTKWKSWKFSFSRNARIHGSRHRAAMPWRQQSRTAQARGDRMTRQRAEDQQLYNRPTMTSWAHCGSLSKRRELVLSTLPTRLPCFCWFSAPGL